MSDSQRAIARIGASHVILTLVRHEELLKAWLGLAQMLLLSERVPPRDRELAILRVALRTDCEYEWANHVFGAIGAGATADEIHALSNPSASWSDSDTALLRAVDDLCADNCMSDDTWAKLAATRNEVQMIETVCLIGYYRMNAGLLNSLGVQPEPGRPRLGEVPAASAATPRRPSAAAASADGPTGVDGNWQVIFHHLAGDQQLTLELHANNGTLSGAVINPALGVTVEIVSGTVDGHQVSFKAPMTAPIQVDISYTGDVAGDTISGDITIAGAGTFPFDGTRSTSQ